MFCFLRFPSGLAAHLHLSWLDPHKERRFTVVGETRMATFDDMALEGKITIYDKGFDEQTNSYGEYITRSGDIWSPRLSNVEPLRTEVEHFVDCDPQRHDADLRRGRRSAGRTGPRGAAAVAGRDAPPRRRTYCRAQRELSSSSIAAQSAATVARSHWASRSEGTGAGGSSSSRRSAAATDAASPWRAQPASTPSSASRR